MSPFSVSIGEPPALAPSSSRSFLKSYPAPTVNDSPKVYSFAKSTFQVFTGT